MAQRKITPKYKQPLRGGLSNPQKLAMLKGKLKTIGSIEKRKAGATGARNWRLGRFAGENRLVIKRSLMKWLQESKFQENQVVAEKLARVLDAAEQLQIEPTDGHMATLFNAFKRLRQAERSKKIVSLAPQQRALLEKYFEMV